MLKRSNLYIGMSLLAVVVGLPALGRESSAQESHAPAAAAKHEEPHGAGAAGTHAGPAAAGGEHGSSSEDSNPLKPEPTLSIWTLIVFIGLMFVLGRFAWKPLLAALHERERHMQHVLEETERARNESEGLLAEHRRQMARAADEVRGILDKARQDAQEAGDRLIKQAQEEAEAARVRAQRDIATARDQALAEIWQKAADMAVLTAGRVLSTELGADDHKRLLEAAIRELPAAAGTNGRGGLHA
jgi:F-type H+-transporting ATPase subunit b